MAEPGFAEPGFRLEQAYHPLTRVYEGMTVHSRTGKRIGTVEYVHLGELAEADDVYGKEMTARSVFGAYESSFIEDFARTMVLTERIPDTLRDRLLHHGFIKVNSTGLFAAGRYVMPDQIASVSMDGVILRVGRSELMRL
jgi:hypothetical protein